MSSDANAASPPISFSPAHCSISMHGSLWVLVNTCINPGDNGAALREGPHPPHWACGGLCAGDTAEMPQAGMSWPREEAGCPGAGRGQLVPDLFKGQRFSTLVIGGGGCQAGPLLLNTHHLGRG